MSQPLPTAAISLLELQTLIKQGIEAQFSRSYWVVAEISEVKENVSGHCYLELVQHGDDSSFMQAKASAAIWSYSYRMIKPFFETTTGQSLASGMKVLVKAGVQYHPVYGLSLSVTDIDPSYTVGELELQRRKTIQQLKADGIFEMNRELELPYLPKRIAIISSPTAAGYQDFMHQLQHNPYGYTFTTRLFPAAVQGREAEQSLLLALDNVFNQINDFDLLVLIRGGGAQSDLLCFDSYRLAFHLAQLPIPVLTGIGHDKDESVADMVAHTMLKTPTAVADFIVELVAEREQELDDLQSRLANEVLELVSQQQDELDRLGQQIAMVVSATFERERQRIAYAIDQRLKASVGLAFKDAEHRLAMAEKTLAASNPRRLLEQGYAIVLHKGKRVTRASSKLKDEPLSVILNSGRLSVTVDEVHE